MSGVSALRVFSFPCFLQRREREILQQLEKKEESTLEIKETFTSLQEEVDLKTRKLNKVRVWP
jgi:hypothetical protein